MLVKDEHWGVRATLATNPSVVERSEDLLIKDEDWDVRSHLAENQSLTECLQDVLTKDKDEVVCAHLVKNKNLKLKPAIRLFYDHDDKVVEILHSYNSELCAKIKNMEDALLTQNSMRFTTLASLKNKAKMTKSLQLKKFLTFMVFSVSLCYNNYVDRKRTNRIEQKRRCECSV